MQKCLAGAGERGDWFFRLASANRDAAAPSQFALLPNNDLTALATNASVSHDHECTIKYGLSIGNLNVRSLGPSADLVSDYVKRHALDVVCFTETWLKRGVPNVPIANLTVASRVDRKRKGGGVAIYCRSDLTYSKLASPALPSSSRLELTWVNVQCGHNRSLVIGCVYRPPIYDGIQLDIEVLEQSVQKFLAEGRRVVLCGDLNCDIMRPSLSHVRSLLALISNTGMHQCVRHPTRITSSSSTLIDIVLVSDSSIVTGCYSEDCIVSDHNLVMIKVKIKRTRIKPKSITFRRWKNMDFHTFSSELHAISWPAVSTSNPEEAWQGWKDAVVPIIDQHAPFVTVSFKHKSGFGISAATRHLIRSTTAQLRLSRCTGAPSDIALYKNMRRQVRNAISLERRMKFESSIKTHRSSRDTWDFINATLGKSKSPQHIDRDTALSFNNFFCSVGQNITTHVKVNSYPDGVVFGPPRVLSTKFDLRPATLAELRSVVRSMKTHTSSGPDRLPAFLFRCLSNKILVPLLRVFNSSITSGILPSCWKIAEVVPIHKGKGNLKDASNYRPISLLSVASKILERLVALQLREYLDDCCVLSDQQFGFRPRHSVEHALIALTESIRSSIDKGNICILVSLDLSKAFDSVDHSLLLDKLSQYGIDHPWFKDYLSGRCQYVRGGEDVKGYVSSGVPQGSVLGPLLFNMYVNDLPTVVSEAGSIIQYADDTQVLVSGSPHDLDGIISRLQDLLQRLDIWFTRNRLSLNITKSQVSLFGSKVILKRIDLKSIQIFDVIVPIKPTLVSLGVTLDSCLTWSSHIDNIMGKCIGMLIRLSQLRHMMPLKTIVLLINSLVLPQIRFCVSVWGNCSSTQGKRIGKIIKFARRIAGRENKSVAWRGDLATEYSIAALNIVRQCLLFPESTTPLITTLFMIRQSERKTRQSDNLDLVAPRTDVLKDSLSYQGSKLWNSLPSRVRSASKTEVTKYILGKADTG